MALDLTNPRLDVPGFYNAKNALAAYRRITAPDRSHLVSNGYDYEAMIRNFERDAVGLISGNPDVRFDIYFPPYSTPATSCRRSSALLPNETINETAQTLSTSCPFPTHSLQSPAIQHDRLHLGATHPQPNLDKPEKTYPQISQMNTDLSFHL